MTTALTTHDTAPAHQHHEPLQAWHPALGEWLPFRAVYGYDPDDPIDDDHAGPSEIDQFIAERHVDPETTITDPTHTAAVRAVLDRARRDRAFRARPAAVRRALTTRARRAARRARRHRRLATRSS